MKNNSIGIDIIIIILGLLLGFIVFVSIGLTVNNHSDNQNQVDRLLDQIKERDKIVMDLTHQLDSLDEINVTLKNQTDSLYQLKQQVTLKYHEIYYRINHSSNKQLDSIIRANWR